MMASEEGNPVNVQPPVDENLILERLHKTFYAQTREIVALRDINLSMRKGEFIGIVGSSGCGKSTLLRIIAGLENNYEGAVLLGGVRISRPGLDRGMVFQEPRLLPWLTVEQNVAFALNGRGLDSRDEIIRAHIELVGLSGFKDAYPHQLSGGMAQRVAIARALVNRPQILLLDEPFGALDALTRIQMQQEILRIWELERTTMILVTHDIDEAIYLGDRVVVMSSRPGMIKRLIPVALPRPRDRNSYEFVRVRKEILAEFFAEAEKPFAYAI